MAQDVTQKYQLTQKLFIPELCCVFPFAFHKLTYFLKQLETSVQYFSSAYLSHLCVIWHVSVFWTNLLQKRLELVVIQTFGSYQVNYSCYGAHNMFHFQGFGTQWFLVHDVVINCKLTCMVLLHLLPNPAHKYTLLTAHCGRTIRHQPHKFIPMQLHFSYTLGYFLKDFFSYGCSMHWF